MLPINKNWLFNICAFVDIEHEQLSPKATNQKPTCNVFDIQSDVAPLTMRGSYISGGLFVSAFTLKWASFFYDMSKKILLDYHPGYSGTVWFSIFATWSLTKQIREQDRIWSLISNGSQRLWIIHADREVKFFLWLFMIDSYDYVQSCSVNIPQS